MCVYVCVQNRWRDIAPFILISSAVKTSVFVDFWKTGKRWTDGPMDGQTDREADPFIEMHVRILKQLFCMKAMSMAECEIQGQFKYLCF